MPIVVYGVGSPILADVAETCSRLRLAVAAWVKNVEGPTFQPAGTDAVAASNLTPELLAHEFIIPLFTPGHRLAAVNDARRRGFTRPATLVDPTAVVASTASLAPGCYVNSVANIGGATQVGAFAFINRGASIGHHVELAELVSIGPAAVIAGEVRIARGAVVGAGAVVLPKLTVGENAVVGAGAVVTRPVPPNCMVAGNPARVIRRDIAGYNALGV
jgi:sugar O-acyltransferase (sialic acid O-acetyltransferase NeuD family)